MVPSLLGAIDDYRVSSLFPRYHRIFQELFLFRFCGKGGRESLSARWI